MVLKGKAKAVGQEQGRQGRQGPVRRARVRGRGPDPHPARRVRRPARPTPTRRIRAHGGAPGPLHNEIPEPDRTRRQHDDLDRRLQPGPLRQPALQQGAEPVDGELVSRAVVRALQRRRLRQRLGPGPVQRRRLRQQLLRQHRLHARHRALHRSTRPTPGTTSLIADGKTAGRDRRDARDLRRLGSLRLRPRRQLRRARRLHRPLPVGPRRRRRGDRRRRPGHRRHLEPPLVRQRRFPAASARPSAAVPIRVRRHAASAAAASTGSATTPSSPRTAASACSRTSSAMTSVCRTSTTPAATPAAPRTAPPGGPHVAGLVRHRDATTSALPRSTATPGRSSSSAVRTNSRSPAQAAPAHSSSARPRSTPSSRRRCSSSCRTRRSRLERRRPFEVAARYFYHSGSGDDLDNTMTKTVTLGAGRSACRSRSATTSRPAGTTRTSRFDQRRNDVAARTSDQRSARNRPELRRGITARPGSDRL